MNAFQIQFNFSLEMFLVCLKHWLIKSEDFELKNFLNYSFKKSFSKFTF